MRVQSIIRELRGEKIDIIEYSEDPLTFAEKALQPAKVSRVTVIDPSDKHLEVIVDDTQLSLAIGKKGQNVRLAAKLLGWKIDIKSEEEKRQEVEQQMQALVSTTTPLDRVPDLDEGVIDKLVAAGINNVEALADMTPEQLEEIPGIGPKTVEKISIAVNTYFSSLEAGEAPGTAEPHDIPEDQPTPESMAGTPADDEGPDSGGQSGETEGLSQLQDTNAESVSELVEEGQDWEGAAVSGAENAPPADVSEVETHEQHPDEENIPPEKQ
jgi:N utilization substance protein A